MACKVEKIHKMTNYFQISSSKLLILKSERLVKIDVWKFQTCLGSTKSERKLYNFMNDWTLEQGQITQLPLDANKPDFIQKVKLAVKRLQTSFCFLLATVTPG